MVRFSLIGAFGSREVTVTWTDGELTGDDAAVERIKMLAKEAEGQQIWTPMYVGPRTDHLSDCYQSLQLMHMIFRKQPVMIGSLPLLPMPPEGSIGL